MNIIIFMMFVSFTGIGTFLHECGHYIAMYFYGLKPILRYWCTDSGVVLTAAQAAEFSRLDAFIISFSGPLVNMIIGTMGFIFLLKRSSVLTDVKIIASAGITFFWSRQVVIGLCHLIYPIILTNYREYSDECNLSVLTGAPKMLFPLVLGIIGAFICSYTVFILMPGQLRLRFIIFGILGSACGAFIWFKLLGPVLLP